CCGREGEGGRLRLVGCVYSHLWALWRAGQRGVAYPATPRRGWIRGRRALAPALVLPRRTPLTCGQDNQPEREARCAARNRRADGVLAAARYRTAKAWPGR